MLELPAEFLDIGGGEVGLDGDGGEGEVGGGFFWRGVWESVVDGDDRSRAKCDIVMIEVELGIT